jgi:hypothetical protein
MRLGVRDVAKKTIPTSRPTAENDFAKTEI